MLLLSPNAHCLTLFERHIIENVNFKGATKSFVLLLHVYR